MPCAGPCRVRGAADGEGQGDRRLPVGPRRQGRVHGGSGVRREGMSRIAARFAELKRANRAAFIPFTTAGDPDEKTSFAILEKLVGAGADLIELGVPFSDPMADGPAIQASSLRALDAGMSLPKVLDLVRKFRKKDGN